MPIDIPAICLKITFKARDLLTPEVFIKVIFIQRKDYSSSSAMTSISTIMPPRNMQPTVVRTG